ncbi:Protein of unknown function [Pyronema omphalodes CBS 100304]|uniref:Uncharacterized protein n=1 Tax=Pyronema omphalodes (strain CBS 100304) TaxID=1076935 RepID=U4KUP9_PYROM|nr:Protein of unknown function [Pyronema omphalodes CBS 100304]
MAVVHGHEDIVHLLLQRENTRVNQSVIDSDYHGLTALFLATSVKRSFGKVMEHRTTLGGAEDLEGSLVTGVSLGGVGFKGAK